MSAGIAAPRRNLLADGPMGRRQGGVIFVMFLLNMADGFDVLAMSFAGTGIARDFGLSATRLGLLFSSGLAGMALGSLLIAPHADRFGRRPLMLLCILCLTAGMLTAGIAQSFAVLATGRIVTGAGAGGLLPIIIAMTSEFSSDRRRGLSISIAQTGFAFGGVVGGLISALLLAGAGWRGIFLYGAGFSALCLVIVMVAVPESPDFLLKQRSDAALARLDRLLRRLGRPALGIVSAAAPPDPRPSIMRVWSGAMLRPTLALSLGYVLAMMGYYGFVTWLPKLLVMRGVGEGAAVFGVTLATGGSIAGALSVSLVLKLIGLRTLTIGYMILSGFGVAAIAAGLGAPVIVAVASILFGAGFGGAIVGLFALIAQSYPAELRATAAGVAIGAGRGGAVVGPILCGISIQAGIDVPIVLLLIAAWLAAAGLVLTGLRAPPGSLRRIGGAAAG